MQILKILLVAAAVFGVCYLVDKGFTKLFRSQSQHKSGLAVRLSKRYGSIGLLVAVLGVAAIFIGIRDGLLMVVCGGLLIAMGICLVVYYISFGIFYDEETFLVTKFGKENVVYQYRNIRAQQLYNNAGHILIELHMEDGTVVQLQSGMDGVYPFLDKAFFAWLRQTGRRQEDCAFYDPQNSCWFPPVEG